ncbi:MAG: proton-conducting transporter membrane subunit, partial [Rickettsiales bacterium]
AAHAFCHIIYKALLLMSAGSVLYMTGERKCSHLGGLFRTMPITCICGTIGALAISAFPATSGFVSKSLISDAAAAEHLMWVWYGLAAASAGVFLHAGIKFPWFVFFQKDSGMRPEDPPKNMRWAMVAFSALCIIPGLFPQQTLYFMLPDAVEYNANTFGHIVNQLQLLLFAGLAFFICLPLLKRTPTISLSFDWLYRRLFTRLLILLERTVNAGYTHIIDAMQHGVRLMIARVASLTGPGGVFSETKALANTTLIVAILLAGYLLLYYNT